MTEFSQIWWKLLILVVCSYLLGNFNIAVVFSRANKKDITKQGSGNPGTMNMYRSFGFLPGLLTLLFDLIKGAVPAIVGWLLFKKYDYTAQLNWGLIAMFLAGISVVIGHVYPALRKFKGGKGVASTIGVFLSATSITGFWYVGIIVFAVGIAYIYFFEWGSIGSLIMTTALPLFEIIYFSVKYDYSAWLLVIIFINAAFTVLSYWKHRSNLKKLAAGKESRTVLKTLFKKKAKKDKEDNQVQNAKSENQTQDTENINRDKTP